LEQNYKYITGSWPIVDYSYVQFEGSAEAVESVVGVVAKSNALYRFSADFSSVIEIVGPGSLSTRNLWTDGLSTFYVFGDNGSGDYLLKTTNSGASWTAGKITDPDDSFTWPYCSTIIKSGPYWYAYLPAKYANQASGRYIMRSSDFTNWTKLYGAETGEGPDIGNSAMATDGNGNWLLKAGSGSSSSVWWVENNDFENMVEDSSSVDALYCNRCCYANGVWYQTGSRAKLTSTKTFGSDAVWTQRHIDTSLTTLQMRNVVYGNGVWLVKVSNGKNELLRSTNGESFTTIDFDWADSNSDVNMDYFENFGWIAGGQATTGEFNLAKSTDNGETWEEISPVGWSPGDVQGIFKTEVVLLD
jgi:hypothetical protein